MDDLPFGIDVRAGLQGLNYDRVEAYFSDVPKPHSMFEEYRVTFFAGTDAFNIGAESKDFDSILMAIQSTEQLAGGMSGKYGAPAGGEVDFDLFYETELPALVAWTFTPKFDGRPKLVFILAQTKLVSEQCWKVAVEYGYRTAEHVDPEMDSL